MKVHHTYIGIFGLLVHGKQFTVQSYTAKFYTTKQNEHDMSWSMKTL